MANPISSLPAVGDAPVTVTDPSTGQQFQIPLPLISFNVLTGAPQILPANQPVGIQAFYSTIVLDLLNTLVRQGLLRQGPALPVQGPTITARTAGSSGNSITVAFSNPVPGPQGIIDLNGVVDVSVTVQEVYTGLTLSGLTGVLGSGAIGTTTPTAASKAGLFIVDSAVTVATAPAQPVSGLVTPPKATDPLAWTVNVQSSGTGPASPAFALTPRNGSVTQDVSDSLKFLSLIVQNPSSTPGSPFNLIFRWVKSVQGVSLGTLLGTGNPFAYVANFTAIVSPPRLPEATQVLPSTQTVTLSGGTDGSGSTAATAATAITIAGG